MAYSIDLRERVLYYVRAGGSRSEASLLFGVDRKTIYHWMKSKDLTPRYKETRQRKLDKVALMAHVRDYPDAFLRERAAHFDVSHQAVWMALRHLDVVKKNDEVRRDKPQAKSVVLT
jgi:transposase